jgi:1,2-phenylacetyl-CoA epoxidase catalytic subunit
MNNDMRTAIATRDGVLKLLSDDEIASVSTAETAAHLLDGEDYLDLESLDKGVQQATKLATAMGRVVPRRSVHKDTWSKILARLAHGAETSSKPARIG